MKRPATVGAAASSPEASKGWKLGAAAMSARLAVSFEASEGQPTAEVLVEPTEPEPEAQHKVDFRTRVRALAAFTSRRDMTGKLLRNRFKLMAALSHKPDPSTEAQVHRLAARVAKGKRVRVSNVEAAVLRQLGIDLAGKLADVETAMTKSLAIYDAARKEMQESDPSGFESLLAIPERRNPDLCQECDDFDTIYEQAAEADELLQSKLESARGDWIDENGLTMPGVKGQLRSLQKMFDDYDGHAKFLKDLARATLTYTSCARMAYAVSFEAQLNIAVLKNRFAFPTALGYSDMNTNVKLRLEDGTNFVAEVQLNHPLMTAAKEQAHEHYKLIRSAIPRLVEGTDVSARTLERVMVDELLNSTALDYATQLLMDKVASQADVAYLTELLGAGDFELDDLAGLPTAPDKEKEELLRKQRMEKVQQISQELWTAIKSRQTDRVKSILSLTDPPPDVNWRHPVDDTTPLFEAVTAQELWLVQQLLDAEAYIDSKAMLEAILRGGDEIVELLLASKNDSDFTIEERMQELWLRNRPVSMRDTRRSSVVAVSTFSSTRRPSTAVRGLGGGLGVAPTHSRRPSTAVSLGLTL